MKVMSSDYVPVIRSKKAEWDALRDLFPQDFKRVVPLIEIVPSNFNLLGSDADGPSDVFLFQSPDFGRELPVDKTIRKTADAIAESWVKRRHPFLDCQLIDSAPYYSRGNHPLVALSQLCAEKYINVVPVSNLEVTESLRAAVIQVRDQNDLGVAIRVKDWELKAPDFQARLGDMLRGFDISYAQVDLIIDFGSITGGFPPNLKMVCAKVPALERWRSLIVASGSFERDLSNYAANEQHVVPRSEWRSYSEQIVDGTLDRQPTFADYTIQCPVYREPPKTSNFSASIRYTVARDWLIMRGEGVLNDNGPGYEGFLGNASLLAEDQRFFGKDFSAGDQYIFEMAQSMRETGTSSSWLRAGINHHMTVASRQVASLFGTE